MTCCCHSAFTLGCIAKTTSTTPSMTNGSSTWTRGVVHGSNPTTIAHGCTCGSLMEYRGKWQFDLLGARFVWSTTHPAWAHIIIYIVFY
jgi:hypothetical protein